MCLIIIYLFKTMRIFTRLNKILLEILFISIIFLDQWFSSLLHIRINLRSFCDLPVSRALLQAITSESEGGNGDMVLIQQFLGISMCGEIYSLLDKIISTIKRDRI